MTVYTTLRFVLLAALAMTLILRLFRRLFPRRTLNDAIFSLPLPELLKRTRIVVIDDVETEFPFKILRDYGFAIDYWKDVKDLPKLEGGFYDIIILDIGGVGSKLVPEDGGVGILKHIKRVNPSQIVIAYSGQSHEPHRIPFFKLADQYVPKPTNAMAWKEILDDLLLKSISVKSYWHSLVDVLRQSGFSDKSISKLERNILANASRSDADSRAIAVTALGALNNAASVAALIDKIIRLLQH